MANRSYPTFGKIKTIVLPTPDHPLTLEEYQEQFGIDLKGFLTLDSITKCIEFHADNSLVLIKIIGAVSQFLRCITSFDYTPFDEGNDDAVTILGWYNAPEEQYEGLRLIIDKDTSFSLANVKVSFYEV